MNKPSIRLTLAILALSLTACTAPKKDVAGLKAEIDAAYKGHYGQAQLHEEMAEKDQQIANHVLKHWEKDYYWNIDEQQKALDAARSAAQHRRESEKELCLWLTEVHGQNHHRLETVHHAAAFFKTDSATPYKTDDEAIYQIGAYLKDHADATAIVTGETDTVGNTPYNQSLSERRAATVKQMLLSHGAKPQQLTIKAIGKGPGPDHTANQEYRTATITTTFPSKYIDCPNLK